ncbi:Uma2 family endonuclease [Nocardia sp. NBC_01503]|uniref:Uma2 family endonuclease n=1 Tax=Nocardia sp. NBC_01503 TaxID=2975997 RepID=UPI002E7BFB73|nr:Uma2 family endonuclease [Nocardia sp. NBC_01503]WTL35940.1 Uma2 family endonuclease [Nocardia sp. NBC_01503]
MTDPSIDHSRLPERLTWEEFVALPEELAQLVEGLEHGRVIWARTGPRRNQRAAVRFRNALETAWSEISGGSPGQCYEADSEQPIFFTGKDDFLKPDFILYRCLPTDEDDVPAASVVIAGEVLSPSNSVLDMARKTQRYAEAGIPWYWEVEPSKESVRVRINALLPASEHRPAGVTPLRPYHYEPVASWEGAGDLAYHLPFPFRIPAASLAYTPGSSNQAGG